MLAPCCELGTSSVPPGVQVFHVMRNLLELDHDLPIDSNSNSKYKSTYPHYPRLLIIGPPACPKKGEGGSLAGPRKTKW